MKPRGQLYLERQVIADAILAADIGIDTIVIARQRKATDTDNGGDIWNEIAIKIQSAANHVVALIQCAEGKNNDIDSDEVEMATTFAVTLVCTPVFTDADTEEEEIFHDLLIVLQTLRGATQHPQHGFRVTGWGEMTEMPNNVDFLGRQIVMTKRVLHRPRVDE